MSPPTLSRTTDPRLGEAVWMRDVRLDGIGVLGVRHAPGHRLPWHRHAAPALVVMRRGAYRQHGRCGSFVCAEREVAVVPAEDRHREEIGRGGSEGVLVFFEHRRFAETEAARRLFASARRLCAPWVARLGDDLARELDLGDACSRLALEGLALELLARASRSAGQEGVRGRPPAWLGRARAMLDDSYADPIGLAELAIQAGVSRSHLARRFRDFFGTTPGAYLRAVRLERAAALLRDSDRPLADVALATGFCDQSHLTNAFRRCYGTTPLAYRRAGA